MSLLDLLHQCGPNAGGLKKFYICLREDVLTIPAPDADSLNISTPITCKTGKKFVEWYFTPDTGKLTMTPVGEMDARSWESVCEYLLPKLKPEIELELDKVLNCQVIILTEDNNGNIRVIGNLSRGAILDTGTATTGGPMSERNNVTVGFKYSSIRHPFYYNAAIPLTAAA